MHWNHVPDHQKGQFVRQVTLEVNHSLLNEVDENSNAFMKSMMTYMMTEWCDCTVTEYKLVLPFFTK